jgi:rhomboid protease GluP
VITFICLNVGAFLVQILYGDSFNLALYQVGAFEPYSVVALGEYWRLVTAFFLHAGPTHLIFNLFALYVLGPPLERSIGSIRFCACYLVAGVGSTTGVLALALFGLIQPALLVGASGSIMGIVGAWAAFLLRHRDAPLARQRLANVAMIIVIQVAFDLSTPQVSMAAHLCGLITGFLLGFVIAPRRMPAYATTP